MNGLGDLGPVPTVLIIAIALMSVVAYLAGAAVFADMMWPRSRWAAYPGAAQTEGSLDASEDADLLNADCPPGRHRCVGETFRDDRHAGNAATRAGHDTWVSFVCWLGHHHWREYTETRSRTDSKRLAHVGATTGRGQAMEVRSPSPTPGSRVGTNRVRIGDTVRVLTGEHAGSEGNVRSMGGGGLALRLPSTDPREPLTRVDYDAVVVTSTEEIERAARLLTQEGWTLVPPGQETP